MPACVVPQNIHKSEAKNENIILSVVVLVAMVPLCINIILYMWFKYSFMCLSHFLSVSTLLYVCTEYIPNYKFIFSLIKNIL